MVLSTSIDGFTAGTPLEALTDDRDAMLAVAMNGEPLPVEHGFPVRMVVPGLYGYVSATKWVVDLEGDPFDQAEGVLDAARLVGARADQDRVADRRPGRGGQVKAGTVAVAGVAWAQHRGHPSGRGPGRRRPVAAGPARRRAAPSTPGGSGSTSGTRRPGKHTLQVRATDGTGRRADRAARHRRRPDGATGWHTVTVTVS